MTTKLLRLSAVTFFLVAASAVGASIPPAENLLPADTLAFFTVPDCNAFRAVARTAPQMMFWNDAAMKPFHDKFIGKLNERFTAPLEHDLGVNVASFLDLLQGQFTLAVTVNGSNGHDDVPPGLLLLLDAHDQGDVLKTNLAALQKKWTAAGRALRTENFHGLAFTVVPLSSNDFTDIFPKRAPVSEIGKEPKPDQPGEIYFAQFQSLLIAGSSAKVVEPVAAHLTGGNVPALADDATFAADKLAQFRAAPTYYGWFNGKAFFNLISKSEDDSTDSAMPSLVPKMSGAKSLAATGLDGLKSASFALRETPDGSTLVFHLNAPADARTGLMKILALPDKDASAPVFVPGDAVKFSRIRLDGKQAWTELQKMVAALSPSGLASLNSVIDMANSFAQQKDPGFDLRNNLINNLGDDIISYQKGPTGSSLAALANPPMLYLVAVNNPDQVIQAIKVIAAMISPQDASAQPRDFLGHKIYAIAMRQQHNANGTATTAPPLNISSGGGYLAFSIDPAILEEYLRSADGQSKPLREIAGLADAAQHVGMGGGLFGYQNQRETMRSSFKLLKDASVADTTMRMFPPVMREWLDFSLLPDYDTVAKYFFFSVYGGNANSDGLTLKVYSPRPPQL
jgi:hypothetical protein